MENNNKCERHTWKTLRDRFNELNPELTTIIDEIAPPDDYSLYLAKYPYGAMILDKGNFHLPNHKNQIVSLSDKTIPTIIKDDLDYNGTMPVGLICRNSIESFSILGNRIIPSTLFKPGRMIGLWRVLDDGISYQEGSYWNVSSGARTLCMLPKITDKVGYRELKIKYGLKLPIPRFLREHWNIFSHLATQENFPQEWSSEIIYFSRKWFSHKKDKQWNAFYKFLFDNVWQWSAFMRNQLIFNFIFSAAQENKNLKPSPYTVDTVKHLIAMGAGFAPGFVTGIDDTSAPITGLQKVFLEDYELKKYFPIILHVEHFITNNDRPIYYSLQMPTTMSFSPKANRASSAMTELRELKHVMEVLLAEILKGSLEINKTPLFHLAKSVKYGFYHCEKDSANEITSANTLIEIDDSFSKTNMQIDNFIFPEFSPFFRGCISLSNK